MKGDKMNRYKRAVSLVLIFIMLTACAVPALADNSSSRAVIGADLSDEQIDTVYSYFGFPRGSVWEMKVTNAEEREYLQSFVDNSVIGSKSISCVFLQLMPEGSGIDISCVNIGWCTPEIYSSALITAGVTDIKIIVAAPFEVSGTAALTGIYKAYEDITGIKLGDDVKLASTQELTVGGELAEEIGGSDTAAIINELKLILDETRKMSDDELKAEIKRIAALYNVNLSDSQLRQLTELCRSLEKLDTDGITQRVENVKETITKVVEAKDKLVDFFGKVQNFFVELGNFIDRVKAFFDK